jgi:hypothetical protein
MDDEVITLICEQKCSMRLWIAKLSVPPEPQYLFICSAIQLFSYIYHTPIFESMFYTPYLNPPGEGLSI